MKDSFHLWRKCLHSAANLVITTCSGIDESTSEDFGQGMCMGGRKKAGVCSRFHRISFCAMISLGRAHSPLAREKKNHSPHDVRGRLLSSVAHVGSQLSRGVGRGSRARERLGTDIFGQLCPRPMLHLPKFLHSLLSLPSLFPRAIFRSTQLTRGQSVDRPANEQICSVMTLGKEVCLLPLCVLELAVSSCRGKKIHMDVPSFFLAPFHREFWSGGLGAKREERERERYVPESE